MKKPVQSILLSVGFTLAILIVLGMIFSKKENDKWEGFSGIYDVSATGTLAYIAYEEGKPGVYFQEDGKKFENPVFQLDSNQEILDLDFSSDDTSLAFVSTNKEGKENLGSTVYLLEKSSFTTAVLFEDEGLITELAFDPKERDLLFYLRAATFENYSPIASAQPHEFDFFNYQITNQKHEQFTHLEKYAMGSLNISSKNNIAYVQMMDDEQAETAENIFDAKQKIFQILLNDPNEYSIISAQTRAEDIYDFTLVPDENAFIFQSVNGTGENGIFEYELFHYNWEKDEEEQLTRLKSYAARPVVDLVSDSIYYIVDSQFGEENSKYSLYKMDRDGKNKEEIKLDNGF